MAESVQVDPDLLAGVAAHLDQVSRLLADAAATVSALDHRDAFEAPQPEAAWSYLQAATQRACAELDRAVSDASRHLRSGLEVLRRTDEALAHSLDGFLTGEAG